MLRLRQQYGHVAKERLEYRLVDMGFSNALVIPACGAWLQRRMDVHCWEAQADKSGMTYMIGSWHPMRECLKRGFTLYRPERSHPWDLEVALNPVKDN